MSTLLLVEFRRMVARRLVKVLVALAVVGIILTGVIWAITSHPPTGAEVVRAEQQASRDLERCVAGDLVSPKEVPQGSTLKEFCHRIVVPQNYEPTHAFALRDLTNWIEAVSLIVIAGGFVIGASSVGAEWHAGSLATLLTWEPRRLRVLVAKTLACFFVVFLVSVSLEILLSLVLALVAKTRGVTSGLPDAWLRSVAGSILRSSTATSVASALGLALATIGRNTATAMGVGFGYLAIAEGLIRGLRPQWQTWLLGDNLNVWVTGNTAIGRSVAGAATVMLIYAGAALLVAGASLQARDIT